MKPIAPRYFWWPGVDESTENIVKIFLHILSGSEAFSTRGSTSHDDTCSRVKETIKSFLESHVSYNVFLLSLDFVDIFFPKLISIV